MLAVVQFTPIFGAVLIAWIFSVWIHEFAHALVGHWGSYKSARSRKLPSFDPLSYIDPVTSIMLPCLFLVMGGVPLPGGSVMVNRSLLRSKHWSSLVSLAGPVSNFILFLILVAVIHPSTGLIDPDSFRQPSWVTLLGALTVLQLFSVFFNLLPIPPLDGFGIIAPYLPNELEEKIRRTSWAGLFILYLLFFQVDGLMESFQGFIARILDAFGLPWSVTWRQFNIALFGSSE